jgi:hypothetical protein
LVEAVDKVSPQGMKEAGITTKLKRGSFTAISCVRRSAELEQVVLQEI